MAFQSVPDTAAFTANFTGPNGTHPSFTLYSRNTLAPWDASQLTTLANAFRDEIIDSYLPLLSTDHTFVNVTSRDLEAEFGRVIEHDPVDEPGMLGSPSLPAEVALRVTFIGDPGSAPARGGIYLLPPSENQVVASIVDSGALSDFQDCAEALHNSMSSAGPAHVIISRYSGMAPVSYPNGEIIRRPVKRDVAVTNTVPTVIVRSRVDSQRKRRPSE